MTNTIEIQGVTKRFGNKIAVDDLNLTIPQGELWGFIGPNGAGKTTTIRMIMSILFPDSGQISVLGNASALQVKDQIGYLPEERGVYRKMKVGEYLEYMAQLKGVRKSELLTRVPDLLKKIGMPDVQKKRCDELSKGMLQKIQFITAIIHRPELLILDEPFSGLDPISMRLLLSLIQEEHARGATILFSTHLMPHAEDICDHVVMVYQGKKVLDDSISNIRSQHDPRHLLFEPFNEVDPIQILSSLSELSSVEKQQDAYLLSLSSGAEIESVIKQVTNLVTPARLEVARPKLEDIFIDLVKSTDAQADEAALRQDLNSSQSSEQGE